MWKAGSLCVAVLLSTTVPSWSSADVSVGVTASDEGVEEFHLALSQRYGVKREVIAGIRKRNIPDDHLPVVFCVAREARVSPEAVVRLRLGGKSWMDIVTHFGLTAELFHVPVTATYGPPYGHAFGHYKNRKRGEWHRIVLADADVVLLANVRFLSVHHGCSADEIVVMCQAGHGFLKVNKRLKAAGKSPEATRGLKRKPGGGKRTPRAKGPKGNGTPKPGAARHMGGKANGGKRGKAASGNN